MKILTRLPKHVVKELNKLKKDYRNNLYLKTSTRSEIYGYIHGLCDAGLIKQTERIDLYIYTTGET